MTVKTVLMEVTGEQTIRCNGCEKTIRRALAQLPGVRRVEPSHKTQRIELTLDVEQTTFETAHEKLDWMGWQTRELEGGSR